MATTWSSLGRQITTIASEQGAELVRQSTPGIVRRMRRSAVVGLAFGRRPVPRVAVRPAASVPIPTSQRARHVVYCPNLDGRADPGEIVWTWVPFDHDPRDGRDQPVLIVGRERRMLLGLALSSDPRWSHDPDWIGIGRSSWDDRPHWVRMDRVHDVPEESIRREGALLERRVYDAVAHRLCSEYRWY